MGDINVFVGNTTLIDPEVYQLWLDGLSAQEAMYARQHTGILRKTGASQEMLLHDTLDYYRTFSMLEKLLHIPPQLANQTLLQIPPEAQKMLIEKYYEFDFQVVREMLGKKLSSKNRKDLDDISDKTNVRLRSCRRQFDNFKRVFKMVEDMEGPIVRNIQSHYLVSDELGKQYAAIVFFANNRFDTGKKRLQYLIVPDFTYCADEMIKNWTSGSFGSKADIDADLDRDFLQELRDLKMLLDKDTSDQHKTLVCSELQTSVSPRVSADMESNFKSLSRALVNIAAGMIHSKERRDFFNDVVEKFIDPCRQAGWKYEDIKNFLAQYELACQKFEAFQRQPRLISVLERYMKTFTNCTLKMYHS
ncbi:FGF intracellular binding protein [Saccoglossus kowalevskii]|uniref:FGF intracellular binding protein n=1 Tax=Saccoglossus kowalevskii TaxID=10224 RepID=D1LX07_SACKO|nr:FGF intracellular binding protein [Saccoglossus kowalevskii]ACY92513.1 FGF intracellular binding protein [Saccoglossus kowalevskii]